MQLLILHVMVRTVPAFLMSGVSVCVKESHTFKVHVVY